MDLLRDVRLTIRYLTKAPGYTAAAVVTLALAIGARLPTGPAAVSRRCPQRKIWEILPKNIRRYVPPQRINNN